MYVLYALLSFEHSFKEVCGSMSLRSNELHQPLSQVWGRELKNVDPSSLHFRRHCERMHRFDS